MRLPRWALWLSLALFWVTPAWGQSPPAAAGGPLTLEEAVDQSLKHNRLVRSAALEVTKAGHLLAAAATQRYPSFNLSILESKLLTPMDFRFNRGVFGTFPGIGPVPATDTTIGTPRRLTTYIYGNITQPLSQQYKIGIGLKLQEAVRDAAQEKLRAQRQATVSEVKRLYYGILQAESALAANDEALKFLRELDRLSERLVREQSAPKWENLEVKAKLARTEQDLLALRHVLATQKEQLNHVMGRNVLTAFSVAPVPEAAPLENDLEGARQRALRQRPEANESRLRTKQAEYDRRLKQAEYIPDVSLMVDYIRTFEYEVIPQNFAFAGLILTWEPFDWGRKRHQLAEKTEALAQARHLSKEAESQILIEVNSKFRQLQEARGQLKVTQMAQAATREKLREMMQKFKTGAALLKDLLQTEASLAEGNHAHQKALLAVWLTRAEYEKALGEDK
ncbi:MAG: TolC family protein [Deltaproteobacteria bacterium]|nr:TolC family protein [Deltaproteobacteria bacterium]